jgi:hypothetical protein
MHPTESLLQAGLCVLGWLALGGWLFKWARGFLKAEAEANDRRAEADHRYTGRLKEALEMEIQTHDRSRHILAETLEATRDRIEELEASLDGQRGHLTQLGTKCEVFDFGLHNARVILTTKVPEKFKSLRADLLDVILETTASLGVAPEKVKKFIAAGIADASQPQNSNELIVYRFGRLIIGLKVLDIYLSTLDELLQIIQETEIQHDSQPQEILSRVMRRLEAGGPSQEPTGS